MGCFSWLCKECGKGIRSDSINGEKVKLFLLKNSRVIDEMEGEYNSYGAVFTLEKEGFPRDTAYVSWKLGWKKVCNLDFDKNKKNGVAAVHVKCWKGKYPTTRSEHDPNQGWGENYEYF